MSGDSDRRRGETPMDVMFQRCAGIAVHKRMLVVCRRLVDAEGHRLAQTRTFGTTTGDLLRLSDWLAEGECTHVGIESTGDDWKPIFTVLEGVFEVWLLNAQHMKAVPDEGRAGPEDRCQGCPVDG
jgi:hypothetical protein